LYIWRSDDLDAGVADQDIERPEFLDDLGAGGLHLLFVSDVHGDPDGAIASGIDPASGGLRRFLVEVGDGDLGAFARENDGDLFADPACRAGDHGDLVRQTHACLLRKSRTSDKDGRRLHRGTPSGFGKPPVANGGLEADGRRASHQP
jgi:hypothetical protein